jgi:hypothetical protein
MRWINAKLARRNMQVRLDDYEDTVIIEKMKQH